MHTSLPVGATPICEDPWRLATSKTREAASAWWSAFTQARTRRPAPIGFPDDLDAATLKDIGAPEWVVSRALEEQDMREQLLLGLRQWRGG